MYKDCIRVAASFCGLAKSVLDCISDQNIINKIVGPDSREMQFIYNGHLDAFQDPEKRVMLTDLHSLVDLMFLKNYPSIESETYGKLINQVLQLPEKHLLKDVQLLDQDVFRF